MNILIVSSTQINDGTGIRLQGIAKQLSNRHNVVIVGTVKEGQKVNLNKARFLGRSTPRIPIPIVPFVYTFLRNSLNAAKFKADIVIASKATPISVLPALMKKFSTRPVKLIIDIDDLEKGYWKNTALEYPMMVSDIIFPKMFDIITTHSEELKKYLIDELRIPKEKIWFLPQGIELNMFKNVKCDKKLKRKMFGNRKVIMYIANLGVAAKDLDIIFKIFKSLPNRKKTVLCIIGSGPLLPHYKKMAKKMRIDDNVIFTGYVERPKIPKYLAMADVAVNYLRDTEANRCRSPIKIREYLALEIPTVCNLIGEVYLFTDYVYGFPTGNMKTFRKQMIKALNRTDKKKIKAGKKFVQDNFDWKIIINNFEKQLKSLVS